MYKILRSGFFLTAFYVMSANCYDEHLIKEGRFNILRRISQEIISGTILHISLNMMKKKRIYPRVLDGKNLWADACARTTRPGARKIREKTITSLLSLAAGFWSRSQAVFSLSPW